MHQGPGPCHHAAMVSRSRKAHKEALNEVQRCDVHEFLCMSRCAPRCCYMVEGVFTGMRSNCKSCESSSSVKWKVENLNGNRYTAIIASTVSGVMMDAAGGGRHGTVPTGGSSASMYVTRKWALPDLARGVRRHVMSFSYEYKLRIPAHERGYSPGWIIDRGKHTRGLIRMHVGSNSANQPTASDEMQRASK